MNEHARPPLEPDIDQIEQFVDAVFRHATPSTTAVPHIVSLRSFVDGSNQVFHLTPVRLGDGSFLRDLIHAAVSEARACAQSEQATVFCPPLAAFKSQSAREDDVVEGYTLSVECDQHPSQARERLEELLGPATVVVASGGQWINGGDGEAEDKLHLHWRLRTPARGEELARLKRARSLATQIVGADPASVPICHPIRWPGSWHRKDKPRLCHIVALAPDFEIELDAALATLEAAAPPEERKKTSESAGGGAEWDALVADILAGRNLHGSINKLAAKMARSGMANGAIVNHLRSLMKSSTALHDARWQARYDDIPRAVATAAKFREPPEPPPAPPVVGTAEIDETLHVFDRWLALPDKTPILATLGAIAANLLPGDPVWLGIVGPPSSAKTEILNATARLPKVVQAATITVAGLLSGTPKKSHAKGAQGGLLRQIGEFGIITLKDFGSILSMHTETRAELLAALREIYDGSWTRHLGSDGGRTLEWNGKLGLLFASTGVIDSHYAVIGSMGDRFLLTRLAPVGQGQFPRALKHVGEGTKLMRKELAEVVARLFAGRKEDPRPITDQEIKQIDDTIMLVVRLRGAIVRDRVSHDIEAIYGAEGTARIGLTLERLLAGLDTLGVNRETAMNVVVSVALDSVPPARRRAYEFLHAINGAAAETTAVAKAMALPTITVRRVLEDLVAYGLATRTSQGPGKSDLWSWTDWTA